MLGNLGYTNVVQYGADPDDFRDDYQRDFGANFGGNGGEAMPFFSFPENIKWEAVPTDLARALVGGTQDAFFYGGIPGLNNPSPSYRDNPLGLVVDLLEQLVGSINLSSLTALGPLNDASDVLAAIEAAGGSPGLRELSSATPPPANAVPDQNAEKTTVNAVAPTVSPTSPQGATPEDGALTDTPATPAADDMTDTPRPRFRFRRGSVNPSTDSDESGPDIGSPGIGSIRRTISDTRQHIRDSIGDITKGVSDATGRITKATVGGGTRGENTDASGDGDSG
jgi:hypothetical protein